LYLFFFFWGDLFKKTLKLCCFKFNQDDIWQECSSTKYTALDEVGFMILRHSFKMAAMMSRHRKLLQPGESTQSVCIVNLYLLPTKTILKSQSTQSIHQQIIHSQLTLSATNHSLFVIQMLLSLIFIPCYLWPASSFYSIYLTIQTTCLSITFILSQNITVPPKPRSQ